MADDKSIPPRATPVPPRPVAAPMPLKVPELSDSDRKRLAQLRAMSPAIMTARTPEQELEFRELERREREALWAAQDARVAELSAKERTPDETEELRQLRVTIDNQRRSQVPAA